MKKLKRTFIIIVPLTTVRADDGTNDYREDMVDSFGKGYALG